MRKGVAAVKVEKRIKIPRRGDGFDMSHNQEDFPFLVKKNSTTLAFGPMSLDIRCGGSWGGGCRFGFYMTIPTIEVAFGSTRTRGKSQKSH